MWKAELLRQILHSDPVDCGEDDTLEIHLVSCQRDVYFSLWSLKTFWHYAQCQPRLVIHDDGTLNSEQRGLFAAHFRGCRMLTRAEADGAVAPLLKNYPHAWRYRFTQHHPFSLKLLDANLMTTSDLILLLDSDVIFFSRPKEILSGATSSEGRFMTDIWSPYAIEERELVATLPDLTRKQVNCGLALTFPAIFDLAFVDETLGTLFRYDDVAANLIEQTCYARLFSRHRDRYRRLSTAYHMPNRCVNDSTEACHYIGDWKELFISAGGIARLLKGDFAERCRRSAKVPSSTSN
ncbi:MAG: hypothetical protein DWQ31_04255 [Planctomycetota bacterium]|nr:MAG: hypothetical protein DWQ31_04255 [Planctomycetota bacterium]REK25819.1 MAG: hypothetical protein DWQ42_10425 [Planctomycetota bacterium]REK49490.1 MAG: hypothetical protein DWQ46_00130 [Planctomycetota bacterium]